MAEQGQTVAGLVRVLRERLSMGDLRDIADDYGVRRGEENVYDGIVGGASLNDGVRELVNYASRRRDIDGLLQVIGMWRPDVLAEATAAPAPSQKTLDAATQRRRDARRAALQHEWDTRNARLTALRQSHAIETDAGVRFKYAQKITEDETALATVERQLSDIERGLPASERSKAVTEEKKTESATHNYYGPVIQGDGNQTFDRTGIGQHVTVNNTTQTLTVGDLQNIATKDQFLAALRQFKTEVEAAHQQGLPEETADDVLVEVNAAVAEMAKPAPKAERVTSRLDRIKGYLKVGGAVTTAAATVATLEPWVVGLLQAAHVIS